MRTLVVAAKSAMEQVRTPAIPLLALGLGPFFVVLIWLFFPAGGSTSYPIAVVAPAAMADEAAVEEVITALAAFRLEEAQVVSLTVVPDLATAREEVAQRRAVAFVTFPEGFAAAVETASVDPRAAVPVTMGGDLAHPLYPVAAILVHEAIAQHLQEQTGRVGVVALTEEALGNSANRTEFESYVPGVLIFALGLTLFSAAAAVAQEVEGGTVRRLARTPLRARELLGGIAIVQAAVGLAAGGVSLAVAVGLGFRPSGSVALILLIWLLTCVGIIGLGLVVGSLARSVAQAFLIANFPFGVVMFGSGTMFPMRGLVLFSVAGQEVNLLDLLGPRHAVNALTDIVSYGSTDIGYEVVMLAAISLTWFAIGAAVFGRRHLRRAA